MLLSGSVVLPSLETAVPSFSGLYTAKFDKSCQKKNAGGGAVNLLSRTFVNIVCRGHNDDGT